MSVYAKSIVAFVVTVLTNLAVNWAHGTPVPHTVGEWVTLVVSTVLATFAVYQWPNSTSKPTPPQ